jgi:hypothetical protein
MLPPESRAKACLETAISNQTGAMRMKWCPNKSKDGHRDMNGEAHAKLPPTIAKMFRAEAKELA